MPGFWRSVAQFDRSKVDWWIAFRNSLAVAVPLAIGVAAGKANGGLIAAIGALNVAYSDGTDPYRYRARRMVTASLLVALAVFAGAVTAGNVPFSVALEGAAAFVAGMMVAAGQTAADIGNITLVTLIVFSAHAMGFAPAWQSGAIALAGGLLQTLFAVALWPVRRLTPERRALASFYEELARAASAPAPATEAPPGTAESTEAQKQLAVLGGNPSAEAERYLALLSQAERIRLGLLALWRLSVRLEREGGGREASVVRKSLELASEMLGAIAQSLFAAEPGDPHAGCIQELGETAEALRRASDAAAAPELGPLARDAGRQVEALLGQLRSALELAAHATPRGAVEFTRHERARPWSLRLTGVLAVLSANLTLRSSALRHAVRMAVCVAAGDALAHAIDWQRSYWIPMTNAIVLRPDFTATFSRGVLRVAGTLLGLAFATGMFHLLGPSLGVQVALIFLFTLAMRSLGRGNYGIFVTVLSAMIVLLIAITGVSPAQVISARALNTVAGGALALLAYALWPTWEQAVLPEVLAQMLISYRDYFDAVRDGYLNPEVPQTARLDETRLASRLARSNLEASASRLRSEPGVSADRLRVLDRMLANSHRFIHAVMSLEAGLAGSPVAPARPAFRAFTTDVDRILELFAAALRGGHRAEALPDLREDHHMLLRAGRPNVERYELVNTETDRIVNSLNTLVLEVERWRG